MTVFLPILAFVFAPVIMIIVFWVWIQVVRLFIVIWENFSGRKRE